MTFAGGQVVACIDAGGSSTRVRVAQAGRVVHRGRGGPANPTAVDDQTVRTSLADALRGCPTPDTVFAAVAGAGSSRTQQRMGDLLLEFFPDSVVTVVPDFVGAFWSCPQGTDVCVVAGTGSVVVSRTAETFDWVRSGGRGWLLSDFGSAAHLGRELLSMFVEDDSSLPPAMAARLAHLYDTTDGRSLVHLLQSSDTPARDLALAAPLVTELAEQGHLRAKALVTDSMGRLAATTAQHIRSYLPQGPALVGLIGGVWRSTAARDAFERRVAAEVPDAIVVHEDDGTEPIDRLLRHVVAAR